jgi:hypothetical protein
MLILTLFEDDDGCCPGVVCVVGTVVGFVGTALTEIILAP